MTGTDVAKEFPPDPIAASQARQFLRQALTPLGVTECGREVADMLVVAANELATNAVLHGRTEFTVRVMLDAVRVRIEVSDGNTRLPQLCPASPGATSGRGLSILDGSGMQWGVESHPAGKTVWAQRQL